MNLTTAAKRLALTSPNVVKGALDFAGVKMEKTGRDIFIDDLAFNEAFGLTSGADIMLTLGDAASMLGISTASMRNRYCNEGGIAVKVGGTSWRIRQSDIAAMLPKAEEPAAAEEPVEAAAEEAAETCCCEAADEPQGDSETQAEGVEGAFVPQIAIPAGMTFSKSLFHKMAGDLEASQAMVASLSLRLAEAIAAWQADCEAIFAAEEPAE